MLVDVVQERKARGRRKEKGNSEAVRAGQIVIGVRRSSCVVSLKGVVVGHEAMRYSKDRSASDAPLTA